MALTPPLPKTVSFGQFVTGAANVNRDGTGVINTLVTAGIDGTYVGGCQIIAAGPIGVASSAMIVRFFVSDNTGSNFRLFLERPLATATPSSTVIGTIVTQQLSINLLSGQLLGVTQSVYAGTQDVLNVIIAQVQNF